MRICKYCNLDLSSFNRGASLNHKRWCHLNPNLNKHKESTIKTTKVMLDKKYGIYMDFNVFCFNCNKDIIINEREYIHPKKDKYFCSRACANSTGGKSKAKKILENGLSTYTSICWKNHMKKCVVCDEYRIVAVHHLDENKRNNNPENLVPLCPTHHGYWHSRFKSLIYNQVMNYIEKWKSENLIK